MTATDASPRQPNPQVPGRDDDTARQRDLAGTEVRHEARERSAATPKHIRTIALSDLTRAGLSQERGVEPAVADLDVVLRTRELLQRLLAHRPSAEPFVEGTADRVLP